MTKKQLNKIEKFSKQFYKKTGKYHTWQHILNVKRYVLLLAKNYKNINRNILIAACYLHDIGRSTTDKGHALESIKLATQFLKKINLDQDEIQAIKQAFIYHEFKDISKAKTKEARLLFDADKLEILSVYGFIRTLCFLVEEKNLILDQAIDMLWQYILDVRENYIYTQKAKQLIDKELPIIKEIVEKYRVKK